MRIYLPVFEHVADIASNNDVYRKNRETETSQEDSNRASGPTEVVSGDDTRFREKNLHCILKHEVYQ